MYQGQGVKKSMIKRFGGSQSGRAAAVFCHIGKMITCGCRGIQSKAHTCCDSNGGENVYGAHGGAGEGCAGAGKE